MEKDKSQQLFFSLIYSFQMQAMIQLGKMKNPVSDKIEKDLHAAQMSIDILDMLKEKTDKNRTDEEARFLDQIISDLKLNYIEEVNLEKNSKSETSTSATSNSDSQNASELKNQNP